MARRRSRSRSTRRRSYRPRFLRGRRHRDKRFPLSAGIGLGVSLFASPAAGWMSTKDAAMSGDYMGALSAFVRSWTGISGVDGKEPFAWNIGGLLNPTSPEGGALKATLFSAIAFKVAKKVLHQDPISKIPILGKYVKMS